MGSFEGHLVPAISLILIGLWWIVNIHYRYYTALAARQKFHSSVMFYFGFMPKSCNKLPFESFILIIFCAMGISLELIEGRSADSMQHITMYSLYGALAFVEILLHFRYSLPPCADYAALAQALIMQSLLFNTHIKGRTPLNVLLHQYIIYVAISCAILAIIEIAAQNNYFLTLSRAYLFFLQGTWFFHASLILFKPVGGKWEENSHESLMLATLFFTWHVLLDFMFVIFIGMIVKCKVHGILSPVQSVTKDTSIEMD